MYAIETESVTLDGQTFRVTICPDGDAPNPLDDWSEMGSILSLNRRHANFDREGVESAIETDPDAVPLSYFEHGQCRWSVAGELSPGARCPFDSVPFAGIWLPDAETLTSARHYGGRTRQLFMRKRARQACDAYTGWCNDEVYRYEIIRIVACERCHGEGDEPIDACRGYFDPEACLADAKAVLAARAGLTPPAAGG